MPTDHELAALALPPARIEVVSPWQVPWRASRASRWLSALAAAWREGVELYMRGAGRPGPGWPWGSW